MQAVLEKFIQALESEGRTLLQAITALLDPNPPTPEQGTDPLTTGHTA